MSDALSMAKALVEQPQKLLDYDTEFLKKKLDHYLKDFTWSSYGVYYTKASVDKTKKLFLNHCAH